MLLLTARSLWLLATGALWLAAASVVPGLELLFGAWVVLVVALIAADAIALARMLGQVELERRVPAQLAQFEPNTLGYRWRSGARRSIRIQVKESGTRPSLEMTPPILRWTLTPGGLGEAEVHITPTERGRVVFPEFRIRAQSAWGLVQLQRRYRQEQTSQVIPSLGIVRDLQLWAKREEVQLLGSARRAVIEQGTAFKELRPYVPGDELRQVDWKASARRGQLIVKEMEPERSQTLFLILDCGRSMRTPVAEATRLDYALHTALALAWIASQRGDLVGAAAFGETLKFFAPPRSGQGQIRLLLEGLSPLQAESVEPDYRAHFATIASLVRKRALMVIVTDVAGRELSRELLMGLKALTGRHLPFIVTLPDPAQEALLERPPTNEKELYEQGAVAEVLNERAEALRAIEQAGGVVVDVPPEQLTAAVVSEYVRLKARGRL